MQRVSLPTCWLQRWIQDQPHEGLTQSKDKYTEIRWLDAKRFADPARDSVSVEGLNGLIIEAVLNLHSLNPHIQPSWWWTQMTIACSPSTPRVCQREEAIDAESLREKAVREQRITLQSELMRAEQRKRERERVWLRNNDRLLGWRGIQKESGGESTCSVLRWPISQEQLTASVMLGFSPCCFSKVACSDFDSILHFADTIALPW